MVKGTKLSDSAQLAAIKSEMDAGRAPLERKISSIGEEGARKMADILMNGHHPEEIELLESSKPPGYFKSVTSQAFGGSISSLNLDPGHTPLIESISGDKIVLSFGWARFTEPLSNLKGLGLIETLLIGHNMYGGSTNALTVRTADGESVLKEIKKRNAAWLQRQKEPAKPPEAAVASV